ADVVHRISTQCFVPLSAGGWITDEEYAERLLRSGADKLVLNTALFNQPDLVSALSAHYGRQCIVASMDVKSREDGTVSVFVDRGTQDVNQDAISWAKHAVALGAGEIFFNSIDNDGARKGYQLELLKAVCEAVEVPVIAFGGVFEWKHLLQGLNAGAQAAAAANIFHYTEHSTRKAKKFLIEAGIPVRGE
ncbi:MAG TPA: HisA/HisF-related TIM barrel protein, partial [Pseudomonadales bacterium]|nr:HisA/HisF-related TIM barrel protein [Pseudomonadales bacterium]